MSVNHERRLARLEEQSETSREGQQHPAIVEAEAEIAALLRERSELLGIEPDEPNAPPDPNFQRMLEWARAYCQSPEGKAERARWERATIENWKQRRRAG